MAGRQTAVINGREYAVLKLLWEHGPLTVREIREKLTGREEIPYTSVLSLVQLMEKKGYLQHKSEGKTYRYSARVRKEAMVRRVLRDFVGRFFDGSPEALVKGLVETSELDPEAWEQLNQEIQKKLDQGDDTE